MWIKQNNLSSCPNVWKCHLPKQNSLSNSPANWIKVKINVSIDDNSVGWEQENQKTFWLYLCRAVTKVIGNRQIKAHFITHAAEIPFLGLATQLRPKRMLANTISSISNVIFFFVLLNKEQSSQFSYEKWKRIPRLDSLFILIWH